MRHTFATLAISVGENINWVARMLGHKSPVVT
jgi:integrase